MKFNKKVNVLQKSSVSARLGNGQRSGSDVSGGSDIGSPPMSPRAEGEDSMSPSTRDLQEKHGMLAKETEVTSTTSTRRELLLKQLRDIEAAIARKKKTTN